MKENNSLVKLIFVLVVTILGIFWGTQTAIASPLQRVNNFPEWNSKPAVQIAKEDLAYPDWMAGTWRVTSTLVEQIAPLAPHIVTPGFAANQKYLNQPIVFQVRFDRNYSHSQNPTTSSNLSRLPIVADRAFNGKNIAEAYLGSDRVTSVKVDPHNPNKQITFLSGDRQLVSTVTGRAIEIPRPEEFIATEVTQQLFRSDKTIYLNEVETTSDYRLVRPKEIAAEQITAIYLSPQDPDYFTAAGRPVALYRYRLQMKNEVRGQESGVRGQGSGVRR